MPWTNNSDVARHNKKAAAAGGKESRQWRDIANSVLKRTGDEGLAIREANGVIKNGGKRRNNEHTRKRTKAKR